MRNDFSDKQSVHLTMRNLTWQSPMRLREEYVMGHQNVVLIDRSLNKARQERGPKCRDPTSPVRTRSSGVSKRAVQGCQFVK